MAVFVRAQDLAFIASGETVYPEKLAEMDAAINQAIADKKCPGGVLWLEHRGVSYHKAYGNRALVPSVEPMTEDTIFDAASVTKVVACTPAMMLLVERGQVKLDEPVQTYIPEIKGDGKEAITVRQLMLHISGFRGDIETKTDWQGQQLPFEGQRGEMLSRPARPSATATSISSSWAKLFSGSATRRSRSLSPRDLSAVEDGGQRLPAAQVQAGPHRADRGGERRALSRRRA